LEDICGLVQGHSEGSKRCCLVQGVQPKDGSLTVDWQLDLPEIALELPMSSEAI
jgi:hypothetical protein